VMSGFIAHGFAQTSMATLPAVNACKGQPCNPEGAR
jgi:hypothetical protein